LNRFKSFKFRLTLWYSFILCVILSAVLFFMQAELSRVLYRDLDGRLALEALEIQESISGYLHGVFRAGEDQGPADARFFSSQLFMKQIQPSLIEVLNDWKRYGRAVDRSTLMIRMISLDRKVIASNLKGWEQEIIFPDYERDSVFMELGDSFQRIHFQRRPIRLYYHLVRYAHRPLLIIQCGTPVEEIDNALQRLGVIILISIPAAVLACFIAGWVLAKRSFRPVDLMIREAQKISAAHLQSRLPRTGAEDEVDRLAQTLNEMMNRIESSTRAVQDFSSDISHELKTPLAIIRGEIDLALRRPRSPEELSETLRTIDGEVNELIRLVDDLMLLVKSDARQLTFESKTVYVDEVLGQILDRFQKRAQPNQITLSSDLSAHVAVLGDALYLKRLYSNLVDNAVKFTQKGGSVKIRLFTEKGMAVVEVEDNGPGIEPELQQKVFSRFYRTDHARSFDGAGLGLNIAKTICDTHLGNLQLISKLGVGTTIRVSIPAIN